MFNYIKFFICICLFGGCFCFAGIEMDQLDLLEEELDSVAVFVEEDDDDVEEEEDEEEEGE